MIRTLLKRVVGKSNIYYLKSLLPNKQEKEAFNRRKSFYAQFLKPGDLYFDIGANLGNRIGPALALGAQVVAVEPQDECCAFLRRKYGSRIHLIPKGAGAKEGYKDLYQSESHMVSSFSTDWIESVQQSGRFADRTWRKKRTVEITTLDHIITTYGTPAFIKIDVEGFELNVLNGLSIPVPVVSFEYAVPEQVEQTVMCIRHIQEVFGQIICNYSKGESMEWANKDWMAGDQMINYIQSGSLKGFGDIYVKNT